MKKLMFKKTKMAILLIPFFYCGDIFAVCSLNENKLSSDATIDDFYLCGYDPLQYEKLEIITNVDGSTTPLNGYGFYNFSGDLVTNSQLQSVYIKTTGYQADGIMQRSSKNATIGNYLTIITEGISADGINLAVTGNSNLTIGNNLTVSSQYGDGVRSNLSVAGGSNILTIGANATITTNGNGGNDSDSQGYAVYAGNRYRETTGIPNSGTAKIYIGDKSQITTHGDGAYAVYANKTGVIQLGKTTIKTTGKNAHGIVAQDGKIGLCSNILCQLGWMEPTNIIDYNGGKVYLTGDTTVTVNTTQSSYAIYSSGEESLIISTDSDGVAKSGVYIVTGDIIADKQGKIDLTATNGSAIISTINNNSSIANTGVINLSMSGASSQWKLTGNSYLDTLTLDDGTTVSFGYDYSNTVSQQSINDESSMTLTISDLRGSGVFEMRSDIGSNSIGDLINILNSSAGSYKINFNDSSTGAANADDTHRVLVVDFAGDDLANNQAIFSSSGVDWGAYKYTLIQDTQGDWYLQSSSDGSSTPELTNTAQNSVNILNSNYLMSYIENQTLLQRMGQLRQSEGCDADVWGRIYTGKLNSFSGNNLSGFGLDYYGIQLGIDRQVDNDEDKNIYYGIVGRMTQGNINYSVGAGKIKSYSIGIYGTYQNKEGFYIDGILKYVRMDNEFNTETGGGYPVKGSGDTKGFAIGAELGKRFYLSSESVSQQGWYLEPQAQLTYSHQGDATIKASNGLRTDLNSYNSLLGRATIIAGYTIVDSGNPVDIYLKTGWLKEFKGETAYTFNRTEKEKYDFGGNWWDNGIGINMQLNKQHNLYADIVYAVGNKFDQKQLNAGYRYSF